MKNLRVAARYAKSLIDLAQDQNNLDGIKADMDTMKQLMKNRDFYLLLKSPVVSPAKKRSALKEILSKVGTTELTQAFARILVDKGRESNLPEIVDAFITQYKSIKHITTVKVTSATELTAAQVADIKSKLLASDSTDQDVDLQMQVDPSIIGGFVLEYDGNVYDASVKHKLSLLRKEFNQRNTFVSEVSA